MLDAAKVGLMAEGGHVVPSILDLDLSTPYAVEKVRLDVGVIIFVNVLRRVQVKSMGVSGVKDDDDGTPIAAQNSYTSN